ncbi:MAG: DUF4270 family protein [Bacteroidales bacterium]
MTTNFSLLKKIINTKSLLSLIVIFSLFFSISCEEEISPLGSNLLPESDKIEYDTTTAIGFNSYLLNNDAFSTKTLSKPSIGHINDPFFGTTRSAFATRYLTTSLSIVFNDEIADSSVLYLVIDSTYGKLDKTDNYKVYQLNKPLSPDSTYHSDQALDNFYDETNLISESSRYEGDTLVIKLNQSFSQFLIPPSDSLHYYRTVEKFLEKYYGIAIVPEERDGLGSLVSLDLFNKESKLKLFYGGSDSLTFNYRFSSSSGTNYHVNFSEYTHDNEIGMINEYLQNDSTETDSLIAIQGLGGMTSKIILENYTDLLGDSKYSVINAELLIPVYKDENFETFFPPKNLYFLFSDADGNFYQTDDYADGNFFGGFYNEDKGHYAFNISKHIRNILNGDIEDPTLYIRMANNALYPHRVILKTGNDIKLKITYTKH